VRVSKLARVRRRVFMRLVGEGSGFGDWCQRWGHEIAFRVIFLLVPRPQ
jgi:hypothetical protein